MRKCVAVIVLNCLLLVASWAESAAAQVSAQGPQLPLPASNSAPGQTVPNRYTQWPGPRYIPIYSVPFTIRAASPVKRFEVRTEHDQVLARCVGSCTLPLPLGSYELRIFDERGIPERGSSFEVTGPGRLEFESAQTGLATFGAVLGGTGAAMLLGGSVILMSNLCMDECQDSEARPERAKLGLGAMALGALLTPIGWVMFGQYRGPGIHQSEKREPRVTLGSTRNGAVIGISGTF